MFVRGELCECFSVLKEEEINTYFINITITGFGGFENNFILLYEIKKNVLLSVLCILSHVRMLYGKSQMKFVLQKH